MLLLQSKNELRLSTCGLYLARSDKTGSLGLKMSYGYMKSETRLKALVHELNISFPVNDYSAKEWAKKFVGREPTTSDVLVTQTHLNVLCLLGLVKRRAKYHGKSPRYTYSRIAKHINLGGSL